MTDESGKKKRTKLWAVIGRHSGNSDWRHSSNSSRLRRCISVLQRASGEGLWRSASRKCQGA